MMLPEAFLEEGALGMATRIPAAFGVILLPGMGWNVCDDDEVGDADSVACIHGIPSG
jgi:hypothetical protein